MPTEEREASEPSITALEIGRDDPNGVTALQETLESQLAVIGLRVLRMERLQGLSIDLIGANFSYDEAVQLRDLGRSVQTLRPAGFDLS